MPTIIFLHCPPNCCNAFVARVHNLMLPSARQAKRIVLAARQRCLTLTEAAGREQAYWRGVASLAGRVDPRRRREPPRIAAGSVALSAAANRLSARRQTRGAGTLPPTPTKQTAPLPMYEGSWHRAPPLSTKEDHATPTSSQRGNMIS